jgi:pSer/pThr/pTyr-binding forkhead associated (FHA) protein
MANVKIPLTFQIYKGSQLVRTEKLVVTDQIRIGKVSSANLKLEEEGVSRMHAEVSVSGDNQIHIIDLGSQKGTFVNGQKVQKQQLRSGDEIKIGDVKLILTIGQPIQEQAPVAAAAVAAAPVQRVAPRYVMPPLDLSQVEQQGTLSAEVQLVFQGAPLQVLNLTPARRVFIGDSQGCEFFVPSGSIDQPKLPILWTNEENPQAGSSNEFSFCFPANAKGEVVFDDNKSVSLTDIIASGEAKTLSGANGVYAFRMTRPATASFKVTESLTLKVRAVATPKKAQTAGKLDIPIIGYTAGAATAAILALVLIFNISPDARSLDLSQFGTSNQFVKFQVKPPEEKKEDPTPDWLKKDKKDDAGGKGKKHAGDEGKMGKKTSKSPTGLYQMKGPADNKDPHLARNKAEEIALNAGVVGLIKGGGAQGSPFASVFGRDDAVGTDPENILGGLLGDRPGEAEGGFGLGLRGTGIGGGGTGEGTLGLGNENTVGKGGGGGDGSGIGRGGAGFGGRTAGAPEVTDGKADIKGSLDKDIIRRVIRRAMPGIKFCYEQALLSNPALAGKVKIFFVIAQNGAVSSASPTSGINSEVDSCVARKISQLSFPAPQGGGIVEVTYPFIFQSAGGGQ